MIDYILDSICTELTHRFSNCRVVIARDHIDVVDDYQFRRISRYIAVSQGARRICRVYILNGDLHLGHFLCWGKVVYGLADPECLDKLYTNIASICNSVVFPSTLNRRRNSGKWGLDEALTTPPGGNRRKNTNVSRSAN